MAGEQEVGRLIVRLTGSNALYIRMLGHSLAATKKAMAGIVAATKAASSVMISFAKIVAGSALIGATLSIREYGKFNQAMTESTSIMTGLTEQQKKQMKELALTMSKTAAQGPDELAKSYFFLASAGMNAEQAMAALPQVTKFATAGAFDMALATDLLTDAQSALGLSSKDTAENLKNMTRLSDVLVKANTLANASVEQFSVAIGTKAGAALKTFEKDVEEGMAVLAALADQQIKGANAGEVLNRFTTLLAKSSRDAAKEHERLGFSVFDAAGNMRNFADIIQNLEEITGDMSPELRSATMELLGFEARVQASINPLLGTSSAIRKYEEQLRSAGGITAEVADKQMQSFSNQMKTVWNTVKVAGIQIGEVLAPHVLNMALAFKGAIDDISGFISWLTDAANFVKWFFTNWTKWISYGVNFWILQFMKMFNDFVFFFTDTLPAVVKILPATFVEAWRVMLANAKQFYDALIGVFKGDGWDFAFEGMSDAFKKELGKIPVASDRQMTFLENQQQKTVDRIGNELGESWNAIFSPKKQKENIESGGGKIDIFGPLMSTFDTAKNKLLGFFNTIRTETESVRQFLGFNEAVKVGSSEYFKMLAQTELAVKGNNPANNLATPASNNVPGTASSGNSLTGKILAGIIKIAELTEEQNDRDPFEIEPAGIES